MKELKLYVLLTPNVVLRRHSKLTVGFEALLQIIGFTSRLLSSSAGSDDSSIHLMYTTHSSAARGMRSDTTTTTRLQHFIQQGRVQSRFYISFLA